MVLIKFETSDRKNIWISLDKISYVEEGISPGHCGIRTVDGTTHKVTGSADEVIRYLVGHNYVKQNKYVKIP